MASVSFLKDNDREADLYIFDSAKLGELRRLDEQSSCFSIVMHDKPIHAALGDPTKILEIGCGTGLMTCYLARKYPQAQVYGIDPSPVPTSFHEKPANVEYIQSKFEDVLHSGDEKLEKGSFDYVFCRMVLLVINDWPLHLARISTLLKPGGFVELQEASFMSFFSPSAPDPDRPIP